MNSIAQSTKQFIFLRNDVLDYQIGAYLAQACHASVAAIHKFYDHPSTKEYLADIGSLTTIIYQIKMDDLSSIQHKLTELGIDCYLWVENGLEPTCIGTRPVKTGESPGFDIFRKKFKLFNKINIKD
jgi:hypothetical protein